MTNLKEQLIRLAYNNPEMREHLLPLITSNERQTSVFDTEAGRISVYNKGLKVLENLIGGRPTDPGEFVNIWELGDYDWYLYVNYELEGNASVVDLRFKLDPASSSKTAFVHILDPKPSSEEEFLEVVEIFGKAVDDGIFPERDLRRYPFVEIA